MLEHIIPSDNITVLGLMKNLISMRGFNTI